LFFPLGKVGLRDRVFQQEQVLIFYPSFVTAYKNSLYNELIL
jgi:hypothetical protein